MIETPRSIRFGGAGKPPRAPFGLAWRDDGEALGVQLASEESFDAVPDAASLAPRTLVVVLPEAARSRGLLAAFGKRTVSRSARCGALLLRGYVDIGAEVDEATRLDLVFGRAP